MRTFLPGIALLATALTATASGADTPERRFTRDGETYRYTVVQARNHVMISGVSETTGRPFELVVHGDQVSGTANGMPVAFRVAGAQAKLSVAASQLAAR